MKKTSIPISGLRTGPPAQSTYRKIDPNSPEGRAIAEQALAELEKKRRMNEDNPEKPQVFFDWRWGHGTDPNDIPLEEEGVEDQD